MNSLAALTAHDLIPAIQSTNDKVRGPAWQGAAAAGAAAIRPLSGLLNHADFETARSARRALHRIVRHAGRPGADKEAAAVSAELVALLKNDLALVRNTAVWLLSEIGGDDAVAPMAALLADQASREDARCALSRIPGLKVTAAFKAAFATAPEDFKHALADSLRERGEKVTGYPTRKMIPTRQTTVKAAKPA
jgi:HEAT repeat protein